MVCPLTSSSRRCRRPARASPCACLLCPPGRVDVLPCLSLAGVNNAFLVNARDPLATTYNDSSGGLAECTKLHLFQLFSVHPHAVAEGSRVPWMRIPLYAWMQRRRALVRPAHSAILEPAWHHHLCKHPQLQCWRTDTWPASTPCCSPSRSSTSSPASTRHSGARCGSACSRHGCPATALAAPCCGR